MCNKRQNEHFECVISHHISILLTWPAFNRNTISVVEKLCIYFRSWKSYLLVSHSAQKLHISKVFLHTAKCGFYYLQFFYSNHHILWVRVKNAYTLKHEQIQRLKGKNIFPSSCKNDHNLKTLPIDQSEFRIIII